MTPEKTSETEKNSITHVIWLTRMKTAVKLRPPQSHRLKSRKQLTGTKYFSEREKQRCISEPREPFGGPKLWSAVIQPHPHVWHLIVRSYPIHDPQRYPPSLPWSLIQGAAFAAQWKGTHNRTHPKVFHLREWTWCLQWWQETLRWWWWRSNRRRMPTARSEGQRWAVILFILVAQSSVSFGFSDLLENCHHGDFLLALLRGHFSFAVCRTTKVAQCLTENVWPWNCNSESEQCLYHFSWDWQSSPPQMTP